MPKITSTLATLVVGVLVVGGALVWLFVKGPKDTSSQAGLISSSGIHWHVQLSITVDGKPVNVPDDTGLRPSESPLHTHAGEPNKIHMEFPSVVREDDVRLGKFFDVWGQAFSSTKLLDQDTSKGGTLTMKVNGKDSTEFEHYSMHDGDKIELTFTSAAQPKASKK